MIRETKHPRDKQELMSIIKQAVSGCKSVAIQAGHFLLYYDVTEDLLLPVVADELNGPRHKIIKEEVGYFPIFSWGLANDILSSFGKHCNLSTLTIVNDWQFLPKGVDVRRFYNEHPDLPQSFVDIQDEQTDKFNHLKPELSDGVMPTGAYFSESVLRNQFGEHVSSIINEGRLPDSAKAVSNGENIQCVLTDAVGKENEVYCSSKHSNCTQEIAEAVFQMKNIYGCDGFINLHPQVCREYVNAGTELCSELFGCGPKVVVNVGLITRGVLEEGDLFRQVSVSIHEM